MSPCPVRCVGMFFALCRVDVSLSNLLLLLLLLGKQNKSLEAGPQLHDSRLSFVCFRAFFSILVREKKKQFALIHTSSVFLNLISRVYSPRTIRVHVVSLSPALCYRYSYVVVAAIGKHKNNRPRSWPAAAPQPLSMSGRQPIAPRQSIGSAAKHAQPPPSPPLPKVWKPFLFWREGQRLGLGLGLEARMIV